MGQRVGRLARVPSARSLLCASLTGPTGGSLRTAYRWEHLCNLPWAPVPDLCALLGLLACPTLSVSVESWVIISCSGLGSNSTSLCCPNSYSSDRGDSFRRLLLPFDLPPLTFWHYEKL